MKRVPVFAGLAVVLSSPASAAPPEAPAPTVPDAPQPLGPPPAPRMPTTITDPQWIRTPHINDQLRAYPPAALKRRLEGHTVIDCVVSEMGTLIDCRVIEETPPGEGFGEAALKTAPRYRMRATSIEGFPVRGLRVRIPQTWKVD